MILILYIYGVIQLKFWNNQAFQLYHKLTHEFSRTFIFIRSGWVDHYRQLHRRSCKGPGHWEVQPGDQSRNYLTSWDWYFHWFTSSLDTEQKQAGHQLPKICRGDHRYVLRSFFICQLGRIQRWKHWLIYQPHVQDCDEKVFAASTQNQTNIAFYGQRQLAERVWHF